MNVKKILFFLVFAFILILPLLVYSQESIISKVEVRGIVNVDSNLVVGMSGLKKGTKLDLIVIQDAIKSIYAINLFSDVQIKAEQTSEGVRLIIQVIEYPKVVGIDILGNKKIKRKNIIEEVMIIEGEKISPSKVKQDINNILELYSQKGYFLAEVNSQLVPTERKGEVILKFNIDEGSEVKIKKIYIIGNRIFRDLKLKKKMGNKQAGFLRSGKFNPDKFIQDKEKMADFYK